VTARASVMLLGKTGTRSWYRQRDDRTDISISHLPRQLEFHRRVQIQAQLLLAHPEAPEAAIEGLRRELGRSRLR